MSRLRPLLALVAPLAACTAPAWKSFTSYDPPTSASTGDSEGASSSTGGDASSTASIMTTVDSNSSSGTGTTTGEPPDSSSSTVDASSTTGTSGPEPVCGDGVVAGEEECDDDGDTCFQCTRDRWIFASAAYDHQGDLGGLEAADSLCRQYALQSGKADDSWLTFIAWLSDSDHDVRDRLIAGRGRYVRTDGVVVAANIDQLYSGALNAPIDVDEHGDPAPGSVLTGTMPDGTAAPGTHCQDWTSKSLQDFSAYVGSTAASDGWWTMIVMPQANPQPCIGEVRLYCVEGK